jgi:hypothetical protein
MTKPPFHFAIPYLRSSPLRPIYSRSGVRIEQPTVLAVSVAHGFSLAVHDRVDQLISNPNGSPATLAH